MACVSNFLQHLFVYVLLPFDFMRWVVLAVGALTARPAEEAGLDAFTVLLQTVGLAARALTLF
jgi:hypothetical protein